MADWLTYPGGHMILASHAERMRPVELERLTLVRTRLDITGRVGMYDME